MIFKESYDTYFQFDKPKKDFEDDLEQMEEVIEEKYEVSKEEFKIHSKHGCLTGLIDEPNNQFIITDVEAATYFNGKALIKSLIKKLENDYHLDIILWELDKKDGLTNVKLCADCKFEVWKQAPYSFVMGYNLLANTAPNTLFGGGIGDMNG